ncbi:MAG TPA: SpoVG family protein [Candidatus Omnitrophota bacterium]|jgi:DNA-binding cell septation regulator SpoVG|nr:SpoVG family protein [Candidatus Omnitrophota bacterium]
MSDNAIQVDRIHKIEGDSKLKAFVDISLDGVVIKGLRVVSGVNGLFVSMPCHQGKDGKWYDTVYPVTREKRKELNELILQAYKD